jgi:WG containing repeat
MKTRLLCAALFTAALVTAQTISPVKNANGKWALVDNTGKAITQPIYKRITATSSVGYIVENAAIKLTGLLDYKGNEIIPCMYDSIFSYHFSDELTAVMKNKKYGFINKQGQVVLVPEFDKISDTNFYKGFVTVKKGAEQFVIDNSGKKLMPSPEPYESNYNRALAAANNSKERSKAVEAYIKGISTLGYSHSQKVYLTAQKFIALMDIDYHGFFETMMLRTIKGDELTVCYAAYRSLKPEQLSAVKALAQYVVDDFIATQNNKTPPPYPAGIPKPGFGWGKTSSSDKVFISQQTNLSLQERYNLIKNKLASGQTVEAADISWSVSYENQQKANEAYAKVKAQQDIAKAKTLIGSYFTYTINAKKNLLGNTINSDAGNYVLKVTGVKENYNSGEAMVTIRYTGTDGSSCYAFTGELEASKLLYGGGDIYYSKTDGKGTCSSCAGKGGGNYNFSHTNDYQYTYGAKVTYSSSTWVNCKTCKGSGKTGFVDYKISCL